MPKMFSKSIVGREITYLFVRAKVVFIPLDNERVHLVQEMPHAVAHQPSLLSLCSVQRGSGAAGSDIITIREKPEIWTLENDS